MRNNPIYGHLNGTMITIRRILRYFTDLDFQDNLPKQENIWRSKSAHENPSKAPISTGCSKVVLLSPSWQPLVPAHSTPPAHRRRRKRTAAAGLRGWGPGLAGQGRYNMGISWMYIYNIYTLYIYIILYTCIYIIYTCIYILSHNIYIDNIYIYINTYIYICRYRYWYWYRYRDVYTMGPELFGDVFFSVQGFFGISCSVHVPCLLQHFRAGICHFNGICNIVEFEPLMVFATCLCSVN